MEIKSLPSVQRSLESLNEILVIERDKCDQRYESALDLKLSDPQLPFPNLLDEDLDDILEETSEISHVLDRAIEHIDLAICALEEIC